MKLSRYLGFLIILILMTIPTAGMAEEPRYQEIFSGYSFTGTEATVDDRRLFVVADPQGNYGVMDDTGEVRIPLQFKRIISHIDKGYFAVRNRDTMNSEALIDADGNILTGYEYADFKVLDDHWVIGIKVVPTTGELSDYRVGNEKYLIDAVDLYDFRRGYAVGSLQREQYKQAKVVNGQYLLILNQKDEVQLYDQDAQPVASFYSSYYDEELYVASVGIEKCVVSRITGETVAKGISSTANIPGSDLFWVKGEGAQSRWGLMDRSGKLITALDYDSTHSSNYGGYIEVSNNKKYGLMRLSDGQLIVPCEYDEILHSYNSSAYSYIFNGYIAVVKNDRIGFVDVNGNVTCQPRYIKTAVTVLGCTLYGIDLDGSVTLIAADGTVTRDIKAIQQYNSSADGYFLSVQGDHEAYGIIDWHGEIVIPYVKDSYFKVRGNDFVIYEDTLYRLIR